MGGKKYKKHWKRSFFLQWAHCMKIVFLDSLDPFVENLENILDLHFRKSPGVVVNVRRTMNIESCPESMAQEADDV